jgi:hypothetical protein
VDHGDYATGFTKDTWVTLVQIKPEFPAVTHHICISYIPHNPEYKYGVAYWTDKERGEDGWALPDKGPTFLGPGTARSSDGDPTPIVNRATGRGLPPPGGAEDCYLPGNFAADYRPINAAKLIPAGSDITFHLHYTPNGTAVTDHVRVGFTVADKPPERRYICFLTSSPTDARRFAIPPNDPNWESPPAEVRFLQDAELVYLMPHMHFRGKDMTYVLEYPDGRKQTILSVPHYDFNWQLGYNVSIKVPKGTVMRVDAHFDISVNNKFNPNPNRTVLLRQHDLGRDDEPLLQRRSPERRQSSGDRAQQISAGGRRRIVPVRPQSLMPGRVHRIAVQAFSTRQPATAPAG